MNDLPKVSIITPLYKAERFIGAAIESVQRQTYPNYEHIIIDDCSPDASYLIAQAKAKEDKKIVLLQNEKNTRVAYTRNRGIDCAIGDYLFFLDADDVLAPDALEILVDCLQSNSDALIYTASYQKMSEDGEKLYGVIAPPICVSYRDMLKTCTMAPVTTLVSRAVINKHRYKNIHHEDYLFWLEILADGHFCYGYCEKPLGYYRLTSNSLSRNKLKTVGYQWNIYRNELGLSFIRSCYYFSFYTFYGLAKLLK